MKAADGEVIGMPESVPGFGRVFPGKVVRSVAIVTGGDRLVARLQPPAVLLFHDVAVRTRERVVAHVRIPLAVPKRIHTDPNRQPEPNAEDYVFE